MRVYAAMSGIPLADLPEIRRAWINELHEIDNLTLTLDDIKGESIEETRRLLAHALETPITFVGKQYSVTMEKQNLLSAQLGLYSLNVAAGATPTLTWNATGEPCEPWDFADLLSLSNAIAMHVTPLAQLQRDVEVSINEAATEDDVNTAVTNYAAALTSAISG
jgi:hypothetical protein